MIFLYIVYGFLAIYAFVIAAGLFTVDVRIIDISPKDLFYSVLIAIFWFPILIILIIILAIKW